MEHFNRDHSGILPYKCKYSGCKKQFPSKRTFDRHIHMHTRPFICHDCNVGYTSKHILNNHVRNQVCKKKSFKNISDSKGANHSNFNFLCFKCNKGFHNETEMILHLKQMHGTSTTFCNICDEHLENESSRREHVVKYHLNRE